MIFSGQWYHDDASKPTVNAKAVGFYSPGGWAAGNRHRHLPDATQRRFIAVAQTMGHIWHNVLSQGERDAWDSLSRTQRDRSDDAWGPQSNGFLSFNARNFQALYYDSSIDANPPTWVEGAGIAEFLIYADLGTQMIDYQYSYNALFAQQTQACVSIYQINPDNCSGNIHVRQTRLIAKDTDWEEGGGVKEDSVPAAFPFVEWPNQYCLFRVGDGGLYHINMLAASFSP